MIGIRQLLAVNVRTLFSDHLMRLTSSCRTSIKGRAIRHWIYFLGDPTLVRIWWNLATIYYLTIVCPFFLLKLYNRPFIQQLDNANTHDIWVDSQSQVFDDNPIGCLLSANRETLSRSIIIILFLVGWRQHFPGWTNCDFRQDRWTDRQTGGQNKHIVDFLPLFEKAIFGICNPESASENLRNVDCSMSQVGLYGV